MGGLEPSCRESCKSTGYQGTGRHIGLNDRVPFLVSEVDNREAMLKAGALKQYVDSTANLL